MISDETFALLLKLGHAIQARASQKAPVKSGRLRGDIGVLEGADGSVSIGNTPLIAYAKYVYFGTGLYGEHRTKITPKRAKALKTPYGYRKSVKGQKPNRYLEDALDELLKNGTLDRLIDDAGLEEGVLKALDLEGFAKSVG